MMEEKKKKKEKKLFTGKHLTAQPRGHEAAAMPMHAPHCPQFNLSVPVNRLRNSIITTFNVLYNFKVLYKLYYYFYNFLLISIIFIFYNNFFKVFHIVL
ncbi:hypothetical protein E1A91_A09G240700v1 [Gossypium mustelinum]|uniref:Uncharacterized protein n=1 Tax=Gossypium mustelinum TaxID=34275 RepID=A0A5D2Y1P5_GOSMU|nr:hypothetical protein E1A91_A09G240700v1 [Gossypium mustelinum]